MFEPRKRGAQFLVGSLQLALVLGGCAATLYTELFVGRRGFGLILVANRRNLWRIDLLGLRMIPSFLLLELLADSAKLVVGRANVASR